MRRFSIFTLIREGLRRHRGWQPFWRSPEPKRHYDVVIVGGGGHGLASAYYLAKNHGIRNVAVVEKGWLGGGNTGRNTTVVRSNYFHPQSIALYDFSLRLYEKLASDLNYNVMLSQRGHLTLAHSRHEMEFFARWVNGLQASGVDARLLDRDAVLERVPLLNRNRHARFPVLGAFVQPRGGVARHDAVAWGYAPGEGGTAGTQIELLQSTNPDSAVGKWIEKNPLGGQHHICYEVPDIQDAKAWFEKAGKRVLGEPRIGAHGTLIFFVHPQDMGGQLTEIMETPKKAH